MHKTWIIAVREYNAAVRTKAFMIGMLIMPLMMGGSILVQLLLKGFRDTTDKQFAVIDRSSDDRFFDAIEKKVKEYNEADTTRTERLPHFVVTRETAENDSEKVVDELRARLSDRVRREARRFRRDRAGCRRPAVSTLRRKLSPGAGRGHRGTDRALLAPGPVLAASQLIPGQDNFRHAFRYQTNRPTQREFADLVESAVRDQVQTERALKARVKVEVVRQVSQPVPLDRKGLSTRESNGKVKDATAADQYAPVLVPIVLMVLMFMMLMMSATPLMQGVVEEKMQRIAEVLLGSVRPFQLMLGKLMGMTGVSLTIAGVYLAGVYWAAHHFEFAGSVSLGLIVWFVLFQALAVLMYGSLFIAIGAACTDMKETQNLMLPVMLVATVPMFLLSTVLQEPNSSVVTGLSFFPFATPMLMIARLSIPPGVAWWQPALGMLLGVVTTLLCVWAAGRIFRVGLLMQGKGARFADIARWVFRG